ncbi:MAG: potassium channel family protein [Candidatus Syntropharchaeia archaeon]
MKKKGIGIRINPAILYIIGVVNIVLLYSVLFLYFREEFSGMGDDPLTAIYWVIVTITTVGYGDIYPISEIGKILVIIVISTGIALIFIFFPVILEPWIERRIKNPPPTKAKMNDHILICGYNPLVESLIDELFELNQRFLLLEDDEEVVKDLLDKRIPCIYGNPERKETLRNACVDRAKVFIANKDDEKNASIILTASKMSDAEMIALIEDTSLSKYFKYVGASRILSPKELLGTYMGRQSLAPRFHELIGIQAVHQELRIAEIPVRLDSDLIGKKIRESGIREKTGATVIGIQKKEKLILNPDPETTIEENTILYVVGSKEQLSKFENDGKERGHFILAGYGDVGKKIASILDEEGVNYTVIDRRDIMEEKQDFDRRLMEYMKSSYELFGDSKGKEKKIDQMVGNATDEEILKAAGIKKASTFIVALNSDTDNIFSTIIARRLNPEIKIIARANSLDSVEKFYDAGADYVFPIPSVAGSMLAREIIVRDKLEEVTLTKGIKIGVYRVKKRLSGRSIEELKVRSKTGCTIIGVDDGKTFVPNPDPRYALKENSEIYVCGTSTQLKRFERKYRL